MIRIICQTRSGPAIGETEAPIIGVSQEDDGTITIIIDAWPNNVESSAQPPSEAEGTVTDTTPVTSTPAYVLTTAHIVADALASVNGRGLTQSEYRAQAKQYLRERIAGGAHMTNDQLAAIIRSYTGNTIQAHWENDANAPK